MFRTNDNKDRLNYGEMLLPPHGYVLERAVGTSYSLDLEALTAVTIALGLSEDIDSGLLQNPISMLHALQKVSEKILIFCDAGQIKMPGNPSPLNILLEKMVIPVALPKARGFNGYPSFHPKTWILQYVNSEGNRKYRFAVLSRNLTFDRSWDISMCIDSSDEIEQPKKTKPLIDFLAFLKSQIKNTSSYASAKRKILKVLMNDLEGVSFALNSHEFGEAFQIMPLGIGSASYKMEKDPLFCSEAWSADYTFNDLVIFSPFLSASLIEKMNRAEHNLTDTKRTLITRKSELTKLKPDQVSRFNIYTLKDDIVDGEDQISDELEEKRKQDIHAKIFIRRQYSDTSLYLGSMNASESAVHRNVEMVLCLKTKNRYLNGDNFLKEIFCDEDPRKNPFEQVMIKDVMQDEAEDETKALEKVIKDICRRKLKAVATYNGQTYDVSVSVDGNPSDTWDKVRIAPLRRKVLTPFSGQMHFESLELLQLSEFYQLQVHGEKDTVITRIIMIPTIGFPEERENAVVNSIVKDKRSFVEYVAFVLGDDYLLSMLEDKNLTKSGFNGKDIQRMPALYEKMLKTAVEEPERLKEIDYLLKMITDTEIVPDEFRELYETFKTALRLK